MILKWFFYYAYDFKSPVQYSDYIVPACIPTDPKADFTGQSSW